MVLVVVAVLYGSASVHVKVGESEWHFGDEREWHGWEPSLVFVFSTHACECGLLYI